MQSDNTENNDSINDRIIINNDEMLNKITELQLNISKLQNHNELLNNENKNLKMESEEINNKLIELEIKFNTMSNTNNELLEDIELLKDKLVEYKEDNIDKKFKLETAEIIQQDYKNKVMELEKVNLDLKKKHNFSFGLLSKEKATNDQSIRFPLSWNTSPQGVQQESDNNELENTPEKEENVNNDLNNEVKNSQSDRNSDEQKFTQQDYLQSKIKAEEILNKIHFEFIELQNSFNLSSLEKEKQIISEILDQFNNLNYLLKENVFSD
jgi:hypothetical protein